MSFNKTLAILIVMIAVSALFYKPTTPLTSNKHQLGLVSQPDPSVESDPNLVLSINKLKPSLVSIQSFRNGLLLSTSGGLVLTEDGLVVTLNSTVPPDADFYQVFIDGKLNRGRVVVRNNKTNLALVTIDEYGLSPVEFQTDLASQSSDLSMLSQVRDLEESEILNKHIQINNDIILGLLPTTKFDDKFGGSAVFNPRGEVLGIADLSTKPNKIIRATDIETVFSNYILRNKNE